MHQPRAVARAGVREVGGAAGVDLVGRLLVRLGVVDLCVCGAVHDDRRLHPLDGGEYGRVVGDVERLTVEHCDFFAVGVQHVDDVTTQLAGRPRHQPPAHTSEPYGLIRSATGVSTDREVCACGVTASRQMLVRLTDRGR